MGLKYVLYDNGDKDDNNYYIMANKYEEKLGFFIIKIHENTPEECKYLIKWKNKLDMDDSSCYFLKDPETGFKELICGFKLIYINTFNIFNFDITKDDEESVMFHHESF